MSRILGFVRAVSCAAFVVGSVAAAAAASSTPPDAVLNEVLYDPDGADTGFEFVELAAPPGADPAGSLAGWTLETGNGANPGEWTVAWVGSAADRLRGGIFLIGEEFVEPRPDAVADLDLQNGPDACRLRSPGGTSDVLGWGEPLHATYREGRAAPDASSGSALARLPDGVDTDCNECDWRAAVPTPGEPNAPAVAAIVTEAQTPPAGLPPGSAFDFAWTLRNVGRAAWNGTIGLGCAVHPDERLAEFVPFAASPLPPGASARVVRRVDPPLGAHVPLSDPAFPAAAAPWLGTGADLVLSEVFPRPADDGPEWIELFHRGLTTVDLAAFRIEDASGTRATAHGLAAPGTYVVVAADTAAVRARWDLPAAAALVPAAPWPALNHTASSGAAEHVRVLLDPAVLEAAGIPGGIGEDLSWERVSFLRSAEDLGNWQSSVDASGATPGRANSREGDRPLAREPRPGSVLAAPSAFLPERDGPALVVLTTREPSSTCTMELFDSSGVLVQRLEPWPSGPNEHRAFWDGRDAAGASAPFGLYVVRAQVPRESPARTTVVLLR